MGLDLPFTHKCEVIQPMRGQSPDYENPILRFDANRRYATSLYSRSKGHCFAFHDTNLSRLQPIDLAFFE